MTKNIELRDSIVSALNKVDESAFGAEVAVMESMYQAYDRALTVIANYDGDITQDFGLFQESFIMEDGEEKDQVLKQDGQEYHTKEGFRRAVKGEDGKLKVESLFWSIVKAIPRLIMAAINAIGKFFKGGETASEKLTIADKVSNFLGDEDKNILHLIDSLIGNSEIAAAVVAGIGGIGIVGLIADIISGTCLIRKAAEAVSQKLAVFGKKYDDTAYLKEWINTPNNAINVALKMNYDYKDKVVTNFIFNQTEFNNFITALKAYIGKIRTAFNGAGGNINYNGLSDAIKSGKPSQPYKVFQESDSTMTIDQVKSVINGMLESINSIVDGDDGLKSLQNSVEEKIKAHESSENSENKSDDEKANAKTLQDVLNILKVITVTLAQLGNVFNAIVADGDNAVEYDNKKGEKQKTDSWCRAVAKKAEGINKGKEAAGDAQKGNFIKNAWASVAPKLFGLLEKIPFLPEAAKAKLEELQNKQSNSEASSTNQPTEDTDEGSTDISTNQPFIDGEGDGDTGTPTDTSNPESKNINSESYIERTNSSYWNSFI